MDKFVEGSATAGTVKSAGLPNITGQVSVDASVGSATHTTAFAGAFSKMSTATIFKNASNGTDTVDYGIKFDASRSSSIYGNSTTVQPPALTMKPFIYTGKTSKYKWLRTA